MIEGGEYVLITDVVLAETVRTLAGRRYRADRADPIDLDNYLLQDANLCFEDDEEVWSAAGLSHEADFADALNVCKAEKLAAEGDVLSAVYTFDDDALHLPGTA